MEYEEEKYFKKYGMENEYYTKKNSNNIIIVLLSIIIGILIVILSLGFLYLTYNKKELVVDNKVAETTNIGEKVNVNVEKKENLKNNENISKYETINGYTYLKNSGEIQSNYNFIITPYAEKIFDSNVELSSNIYVNDAYVYYCELVREIEKVDYGIIPGGNKQFAEVTFVEVDDAYKNYLREISQIRQIFDLIHGNDDYLENHTGCHYKGTRWNSNNNKYKAKDFKATEISLMYDYW